MIKAGFLQFEPQLKQPQYNVKKIESFVKSAPMADLIVLPELALTGYCLNSKDDIFEIFKPLDKSDEIEQLIGLAKEKSTNIIIGVPEIKNNTIYNSAVWLSGKGIEGIYRKIHLFLWEKLLFSPGDNHPPVWNINGFNVGVMICFDWIFPEISRGLMLSGAQIVVHPSNLVLPLCQKVMPARCIENRIFTITANRIGTETNIEGKKIKFTGNSIIVDPEGNVLQSAGENEECIKIVEINTKEADNKNITKLNNIIEDRKPGLYFQDKK